MLLMAVHEHGEILRKKLQDQYRNEPSLRLPCCI
jgi:hypothetical protein